MGLVIPAAMAPAVGPRVARVPVEGIVERVSRQACSACMQRQPCHDQGGPPAVAVACVVVAARVAS